MLEFALRVDEPPAHIAPLFVTPVDDGTGLTVTVVVYTVDGLHPLPVLLSVNENVVVTLGVTLGFGSDELKPGPVHDHEVALLELAFSVADVPVHTTPLFVAPVDDGTGFTVTVVVYTVDGLQPLPVLLSVNE